MVRKNSNNRGFTFIELLLAFALLAIVITISTRMLIFGTNANRMVGSNFQLQSAIRVASTTSTQVIKYSTAIFTMPKSSFRADNLTPGWNYFGLSEDSREIIQYIWEDGTHRTEVLVPAMENMIYSLEFDKNDPDENDKLIQFTVSGEENGSGVKKILFKSELDATNALQVIHKGTSHNPAVAMAYRSDERPTDTIVGVVTLVLDKSGSMENDVNDDETEVESEKRINKLIAAAKDMISKFSVEENIEMCVVTFSTNANNTGDYVFYDVSDPDDKSTLDGIVDGIETVYWTNTGDGMRRGYHAIDAFGDSLASGFSASNYMIILTDGATNTRTTGTDGGDRFQTGNVTGTTGSGGQTYATDVGSQLINPHTPNIKTYLIGYSTDSNDNIDIGAIAASTGSTNVYEFTEDMDLVDVFTEIKADIMRELWHIRGPRL